MLPKSMYPKRLNPKIEKPKETKVELLPTIEERSVITQTSGDLSIEDLLKQEDLNSLNIHDIQSVTEVSESSKLESEEDLDAYLAQNLTSESAALNLILQEHKLTTEYKESSK